jgi:hypothetical protein
MPDADLERLATENVEQWLDRIKDKDPRFFYEVTFGGDQGPNVFSSFQEPGLIASFSDGTKTVKAYVRDHDALRRDPVGMQVRVAGSGVHKILDFIKTGKGQILEQMEFIDFVSTMPLLSMAKFELENAQLLLQSFPDQKLIPLRLTFATPGESVILNYVEFKKTRHGTEEVEIETTPDFPLYMRLILPREASPHAQMTIAKHFIGKSIRTVAQASTALRFLQQGCNVELFSLAVNGKLGKFSVGPINLELKPGFFSFIDDLFAISAKFACDIRVPHPDEVTEDADEIFRLLRALAKDEPLPLKNVTIQLVKSAANAETLPQTLAKPGSFRMEHKESSAVLFGTHIDIGAVAMQFEGEVSDLQEMLSRFRQAEIGDSVPVSFRLLAPVQLLLLDRVSEIAREASR